MPNTPPPLSDPHRQVKGGHPHSDGTDPGPELPDRKLWAWLVVGGIAVVAVWLAVTYLFVPYVTVDAPSSGATGDIFGGVNALFSGLAFGGLIVTLVLQRDELRAQRNELRLTRIELRGQAAALSAQERAVTKQTLEATFLRLMELHTRTVDSFGMQELVHGRGSGLFNQGPPVPRSIGGKQRIKDLLDELLGSTQRTSSWQNAYRGWWEQHGMEFRHYFRHIEALLGFLEESQQTPGSLLPELFRAHVTESEAMLLVFHAAIDQTSLTSTKLGRLCYAYGLFDLVPMGHLPDELGGQLALLLPGE